MVRIYFIMSSTKYVVYWFLKTDLSVLYSNEIVYPGDGFCWRDIPTVARAFDKNLFFAINNEYAIIMLPYNRQGLFFP